MLNCSTYLFGNYGGKYFQYPSDSTQEQLQRVSERFDSESQIAVFSENRLMYYAYMFRTGSRSSHSYFGICAIVNDVMTYNITSMFRLFEKACQEIALSNRILTIDDGGVLNIKSTDAASLQSEHNSVSDKIEELMSEGEQYFETIPVMRCSNSNNDFCTVPNSPENQNFRAAIRKHKLVYVVKSNVPMTPDFNGLALKIKDLNDQLRMLEANNEELKKKIKLMSWNKFLSHIAVPLIFLLIAVFVAAVYFIKYNLIQLNF